MDFFMDHPSPHRRIYLLTVWKESSQESDPSHWSFRLEDPRTGQSCRFADAATLVVALLRGWDGEDKPPDNLPENLVEGQ
jgi:hypothetical protein